MTGAAICLHVPTSQYNPLTCRIEMGEETAGCHTCHLQSCPEASKGHTESMPFTMHYCKWEKHDESSLCSFVFAFQTLKPEAVTTLGKLRLCLNRSKVKETIVTQSNAATVTGTAAAADGDDGDDKYYNILTHCVS